MRSLKIPRNNGIENAESMYFMAPSMIKAIDMTIIYI